MELPKNDMVDRQFYDHRRASELIKTRRNTLNPGECLSLLTREKIKMEKKVAGENKFTFQAVFTLSGGLVLMMVAGLPYAYGNISPYIVSYFRMFQRYNVDYDTSSNSGNWQAVFGGGLYAMPWFRILSPWSQSEKNDTDSNSSA